MTVIQPGGGTPLPYDRYKPNQAYDIDAQCCATCRYWLPEQPLGGEKLEANDVGFGACRRRPPVILEAMARMIIRPMQFGQQMDPDECFNIVDLFHVSHQPGTHIADWCGEYEPAPAGIGRQA